MNELELLTSEQKDHAEYSASGSSRWINCPGSHELAKKYPPLPETKYAAEGTNAHACLEFLLKNRENLKAAVVSAGKKWPKEMVEHGLGAVEYVLARQKDLPGSDILCETKVDATSFLGIPGQFGTLDIAIVQEFGVLEVIDYKYGAGIGVEPREDDGQANSQLVYYGLGVADLYHYNFSKVVLTVIQPRAFHPSGETIRSTDVTMLEFSSWTEKFKNAVLATQHGSMAPLKSGKWCKFCPAAIDCPEIKERSLREAQAVFSDQQGLVSVVEPAMIQLPNLGVVLDACDRLEDWITKVRAHAIHVLGQGREVPGYKLVQKRGVRKWLDEDATEAEARAMFGDVPFTEPELKSPAQVEKSVGAQFGTKFVKKWVEDRTTSVSSGTTLAPASDKRPAVTGSELLTGAVTTTDAIGRAADVLDL